MEKKIALIAAMSENHVIGQDNKLPWHLPADWENFHRVTAGKPYVMGRKSYESEDALISANKNVILTRHPEQLNLPANCQAVDSIEKALELLQEEPVIFILGGAEVYAQTLDLANYLYLTIVHHVFGGDAFFPEIDWNQWEMVDEQKFAPDDRHAYSFSINEYRRK